MATISARSEKVTGVGTALSMGDGSQQRRPAPAAQGSRRPGSRRPGSRRPGESPPGGVAAARVSGGLVDLTSEVVTGVTADKIGSLLLLGPPLTPAAARCRVLRLSMWLIGSLRQRVPATGSGIVAGPVTVR